MKGVADIVEELLRDEKVFGRTRVLRNSAPRIGSNMADEEEGSGSKEIFDDTDFYHQLLRDVVESKKGSNGMGI
jgi:protein AATF/BFR2